MKQCFSESALIRINSPLSPSLSYPLCEQNTTDHSHHGLTEYFISITSRILFLNLVMTCQLDELILIPQMGPRY